VGLSANGGANFNEPPFRVLLNQPDVNIPLGNAQMHFRNPTGTGGEWGMLASLGYTSMLSGGVYVRGAGISNDIISVAPQGEIGWLWMGVRLPTAVKLDDKVWLTTQPAIQGGMMSSVFLPLGVSRTLGEGWRLDSEIGARYHLAQKEPGEGPRWGPEYEPWSLMAQVGISYLWSNKRQIEELKATGVSGATIIKQP
jgi:hypothetical protein